MAANAKIIAVVNEKGGAGKTQTAGQLAGTLGRRGFDVLLADCDGQASSTQWAATKGGENFRGTCWRGAQYNEQIPKQLAHLAPKHDVIVVDCGAGVDVSSTWGTLLVADLAIIPTKLGATDIGSLPATKRLMFKAWEKIGRRYPAVILPMAVKLHLRDDKDALKYISADPDFPLLRTSFGDRRAFPRSVLKGGTVHDIANSGDSVREVESLVDEVQKILKIAPAERMVA